LITIIINIYFRTRTISTTGRNRERQQTMSAGIKRSLYIWALAQLTDHPARAIVSFLLPFLSVNSTNVCSSD